MILSYSWSTSSPNSVHGNAMASLSIVSVGPLDTYMHPNSTVWGPVGAEVLAPEERWEGNGMRLTLSSKLQLPVFALWLSWQGTIWQRQAPQK